MGFEFVLRLEFSKISRNVLARPVMGTIFLVNCGRRVPHESLDVLQPTKEFWLCAKLGLNIYGSSAACYLA